MKFTPRLSLEKRVQVPLRGSSRQRRRTCVCCLCACVYVCVCVCKYACVCVREYACMHVMHTWGAGVGGGGAWGGGGLELRSRVSGGVWYCDSNGYMLDWGYLVTPSDTDTTLSLLSLLRPASCLYVCMRVYVCVFVCAWASTHMCVSSSFRSLNRTIQSV
jgi:hypothetical protein